MPNQVTDSSTIPTCVLRYVIQYLLAGVLLGAALDAPAQSVAGSEPAIARITGKLCKESEAKINRVNSALLRDNIRCLQRMEAREEKIRRKLTKKGVDTALFNQAAVRYASLRKALEAGEQTASRLHRTYTARLDTLQAGLHFITGIASGQPEQVQQQLQHALGNIRQLQDRFGQAEEIQRFIEQRSRFLQQQSGKWGLIRDVKELQKQAYYYRAQVQQYKSLFNNPSKLESEAFRLLKELSPFRQFFQSYSWLAARFSLPARGGETTLINPDGLQSRELVAQSLAQRFGSPVQVQQLLQQGQGAQPVIGQLKHKIKIPGSGGSEAAQLPRFQPNSQKTHRFRNRLELGSNVQTVRANRFFPSSTDIGLSIGYKLNDKSTAGIGGAYRMGWGRSIRHISITHGGLGIRSFVDYQVKGNIWLSGGAELNYRSRFSNFEILEDYSAWQKSVLIGISKKYTVSNKLNGNMQLLYDILWKQQVPRTQALVFRIGYNFK